MSVDSRNGDRLRLDPKCYRELKMKILEQDGWIGRAHLWGRKLAKCGDREAVPQFLPATSRMR